MSSRSPSRRRGHDAVSLRESLTQLWQDPVIGLSFKVTAFLLGFFIFILLFFYWRLPPEIPLTYSRPWGGEQLVSIVFLFVIFSLIMLIVLANALLATFLFSREQLLARILVWISTLVVLLVDITVLRVVLLVT